MMKPSTPRLEQYPERVAENARAIFSLCHKHGIAVASVGKVICAQPEIMRAIAAAGADMLADSRLENLASLREMGLKLPLMLLRIPTPSQVAETVRVADISLVSDLETIVKLAAAASANAVIHKVILMIDLGDLREGIWPDKTISTLRQIITLPGIEVIGLGANLACYGGVIPTTEKMQQLINLRDKAEAELNIALPVLCGGNSANLPLLAAGGMPSQINLLRIGETIILGRNVLDRSPFPETRQDTFRLVAEIIEIEEKPSVPIGERGQDAFGGTPQFIDRGLRKRAICNLGRQDTDLENIEPENPAIIVLGGSSDHLLLDVHDVNPPLAVGDEVAFLPGYSALLAASTSSYVEKVVIFKNSE
ncbi:MAG: alanine/ornithine racemase family PLP-dependent enzyme [Anaerolineaceae bacterium]|nr:alanine/ornithine racemase family PLP-dependent enzyme [Anaerolineaceae bacterium]